MTESRSVAPSFKVALAVWAKIGVLSFGGPAGRIALMHRVLVDERRWIGEDQFLRSLNFCMLLPGPEAMQLATYVGWRLHGAMQLATYVGWRLHGTLGGLVAGLLFVLPGALVVLALSIPTCSTGMCRSLRRRSSASRLPCSSSSLRHCSEWHGVLCGVPMTGSSRRRRSSPSFSSPCPSPSSSLWRLSSATSWRRTAFRRFRSQRRALCGLPRLCAPPASGSRSDASRASVWTRSRLHRHSHLLFQARGGHLRRRLFRPRLHGATGGRDLWLAEHRRDARWLGSRRNDAGAFDPRREFVGFLAGYRHGGEPKIASGLLGAAITLWATFVPCCLWIFVGAPYVERLSRNPRLSSALSGVTAALGVILNLNLWFALHVFFAKVEPVWHVPLRLWLPDVSTLDVEAMLLACLAALLLLRLKFGIAATLAICTSTALAWFMLSGVA